MPIVSVFYGMIIRIYYSDHNPPHFHVNYGDKEIMVGIRTGRILKGGFPKRLKNAIEEWRLLHKDELLAAWNDAQQLRVIRKIKPLE